MHKCQNFKSKLMMLASISILAIGATSSYANPNSQAKTISFITKLSQSQEVDHKLNTKTPKSASGYAEFIYHTESHNLTFKVHLQHLSGKPSMAHFHEGITGVNGPVLQTICGHPAPTLLPKCPTSGNTVMTGTWKVPTKDAGKISNGSVFINIHTDLNPAGEIRGQLKI